MNKETKTKGTSYSLDELVTVAELSTLLHVAEKTVYDWVYKKVIPFTKLRGRVYFSREMVNGLLNENAREPLASPKAGSLNSGVRKDGATCEEDNNGIEA